MQLKIKRTQAEKGLIFKKPIYNLAFRVEYSEEERAAINSRDLGGHILYEADEPKLRVTIRSIKDGHQVSHEDLARIGEVEQGVNDALKNLKQYLLGAQSHGAGEEGVIEI